MTKQEKQMEDRIERLAYFLGGESSILNPDDADELTKAICQHVPWIREALHNS